MKSVLLFLFLILCNYSNIIAQENRIQDSVNLTIFPKNELYILDSIQEYRNIRLFKMDNPDYYLYIHDGYVVLSFQIRGRYIFTSGKINKSSISIIDGDSVNTFLIITDNKFPESVLGRRFYFGTERDSKTKSTVYILNNRKQPEYSIKAHIATVEEKERLIKQSQK